MPRRILAEAAVWVTRLHGPDRSRAMELECLAWQARSAVHRLAFERCTDAWLEVGGLTREQVQAAIDKQPGKWSWRGRGTRVALAVAVPCCVAVIAVLGVLGMFRGAGDTYSTGVGEQRQLVLADGSRLTLNTATDIRVKLTDALREVTVERGEALFEVAKDAGRPFVVGVSDAKVVATGTAFLVRSTPPAQAGGGVFGVTLLEGQVLVQRSGRAVRDVLSDTVVMKPGERLQVRRLPRPAGRAELGPAGMGSAGAGRAEEGPAEPEQAQLDRPPLDRLLAWKRGLVDLGDVTLPEAIADMNRYSAVQITLADPQALGVLRVSGTYRTGDNRAFAEAVARLHGLVVRPRDGGVELASR
ncbi:FecR family protein [Roseateles sp.]|uniref:FecR family protein n=1 Tax=Roseateles sp. TaxID=1971397 RepID=UPI0039E9BA64